MTGAPERAVTGPVGRGHHLVYGGAMERTQVYLSEEDLVLLEREADRSGASRSELIRRAVRARYGPTDVAARRDALDRSAGSWRDRDVTGERYVEAVRGDLTDRLDRLGAS